LIFHHRQETAMRLYAVVVTSVDAPDQPVLADA